MDEVCFRNADTWYTVGTTRAPQLLRRYILLLWRRCYKCGAVPAAGGLKAREGRKEGREKKWKMMLAIVNNERIIALAFFWHLCP